MFEKIVQNKQNYSMGQLKSIKFFMISVAYKDG